MKKVIKFFRELWWKLRFESTSVTIYDNMWQVDPKFLMPYFIIPRDKHKRGASVNNVIYYVNRGGSIRYPSNYAVKPSGDVVIFRHMQLGIGMPIDSVEVRIF